MIGKRGRGRNSPEGRPPNQRQLRVAEIIRHRLSDIIARGDFEASLLNRARVTVTEVRISPDLKQATAFVMPLGGAHLEEIVKLLNAEATKLRRLIAQNLHLRYTPTLTFRADGSFDEAASIDELLNSAAVRRDLDKS